MKILFPDGDVSDSDFSKYCLAPAIRMRQLVWDQLYSLDAEYRQYEKAIKCRLI